MVNYTTPLTPRLTTDDRRRRRRRRQREMPFPVIFKIQHFTVRMSCALRRAHSSQCKCVCRWSPQRVVSSAVRARVSTQFTITMARRLAVRIIIGPRTKRKPVDSGERRPPQAIGDESDRVTQCARLEMNSLASPTTFSENAENVDNVFVVVVIFARKFFFVRAFDFALKYIM